MLSQQPTLHSLHRGSTVRHLLIEGNDPGAKTLSRLDNGVRTVVATGTHYEMDQKAMALIEEWCQNEEFKWRGEDGVPVWESLRDVLALAKLMGHTSLYDFKHNLPVTVPLDRWQGCKDKNGDDYQYGYTGTTIEACPRVTAKHGVSMVLSSNTQEMVGQLAKIIEIRRALGPDRKFVLD
jgi:hypothetical protein